MENEDDYIDFHCHPTLKPFGKSFNAQNEALWGKQSNDTGYDSSIWKEDKVKKYQLDRALNTLSSLTKFRQKSFKTVAKSNGRILILAVGPMEKGLVQTKLTGKSIVTDIFINLVTGVGKKRINYVQDLQEYFEDLEKEIQFLNDMPEEPVSINGETFTYRILKNYQDYKPEDKNIINLILSFEGAYVFNTGLKTKKWPKADEKEVLGNISKVKGTSAIWNNKPFFVTLGHHYYNELCGHHRTYPSFIGKLVGQKINHKQGITDLGWKVIKSLLSTTNGKRILIDVKHMNAKSRYQFYGYLKDELDWKDDSGNKIPLIYSHGSFNEHEKLSDLGNSKRRIKHAEINLFNEEILWIKNSGGIIGLQLDKRRLSVKKSPKTLLGSIVGVPLGLGKSAFKTVRMLFTRDRKLRKRSIKLIWSKLLYAAKCLDENDEECWGTVCLGTDFDGIVNPLNGFWTAREIPIIKELLLKKVEDFMKSAEGKKLKVKNQIKAEVIVHKFMYSNAREFLQEYFK